MTNMMEGTWVLILWSHHTRLGGLECKGHMREQCSRVWLSHCYPNQCNCSINPSLQSLFPGTTADPTADPRASCWEASAGIIPSHGSVAELRLRVACPRPLTAEWIPRARGKGRWTEFGRWGQTNFGLKTTSLLTKPYSERPCENNVCGKLGSQSDCRHFCSQNAESLLPRQVLFPRGILVSESSALRERAVGAPRT